MAFGRKKRDDAPASGEKKPGRIAQYRAGYQAVKSLDPTVGRWMAGSFVLTLALIVAIGALLNHPVYAFFLGLPTAAIVATLVLNRRTNTAMYSALEGKAGASGAALAGITQKGWYLSQEPVAVDANRATRMEDLGTAAMVFRALGKPGVVLVGEGPSGRVKRLLDAERKKVSRVAPGVPVHVFVAGDGEGEVPVPKLISTVTKLKGTLTKQEVSAVNKRLKSLPGMRAAIPAGIDPNKVRVDRRAMRGR